MIIRRCFLIPGLGPAGRLCRMLPDFAFYKPGAMPQDNLPASSERWALRFPHFPAPPRRVAMHKTVNAPSGGPRRLTDRAFLFGRLLLCQLFSGGLPFFARFSMRSLDAAACSCWLFCRNFDFGTLCPKVPDAPGSCSEPAQKQSRRARQPHFGFDMRLGLRAWFIRFSLHSSYPPVGWLRGHRFPPSGTDPQTGWSHSRKTAGPRRN